MTDRDALLLLAERGEPRGADELIARLEARLEHRPVVAAEAAGDGGATPLASVWLRVAVAVIAILSLGALALLSPLFDRAQPAPPVVTGPDSIGPTIPDAGLVWSRVPDASGAVFGGPGEYELASVSVGGPGLVAVGRSTSLEDGYGSAPAVWTSVDGLVWSRVPRDSAEIGGDPGVPQMVPMIHILSVVAGGPGLVAVGHETEVTVTRTSETGVEVGTSRAAVWTSVDGLVWTRVPHDDAVFGGPVGADEARGDEMRSVTVGGPGLVAVGTSRGRGAVWVSVDGLTWSRVRDVAALGAADYEVMESVVAGGPGLVAVGWSHHPTADEDTAVWTSVDGSVWSRVPHDEAVFGGPDTQLMLSVTAGGPGLVAVGRGRAAGHEGFSARVWTSADGLAWAPVPHDESVFGDDGPWEQSMRSVVAVGPGLVAVGHETELMRVDDRVEYRSMRAVVWSSVDGLVWTRASRGALGSMAAVAVGGPGLVAVGQDVDGRAAVWLSHLSD